ncbi:MAG TPA: hypothetical protein VF331_18625 [Polyangiales bacterium]
MRQVARHRHLAGRALRRLCGALIAACLGCSGAGGLATARPTASPASTAAGASDAALAPSLAPVVARISGVLAQLGVQPGPDRYTGFLPSGNHATFAVHVAANSCVTWLALATKTVQDVDAALYTPEGELLAVDSEPNAHPTIQTCAGPVAKMLYYVVQLYEGDGSFVVASFSGPRSALGPVARVLGGRPAFAEAVGSHELEEDAATSLAEGLRKHGFEAVRDPLVFKIAERERVRTSLPVQIGKCYTIAAFGDAGISELAVRVLDQHGAELGAGAGGHAGAAVQLCVHEPGDLAIESEAQTGAGEVTLLVYRADVISAGGEAGLWLGKRDAAPPEATSR